MPSTLQPFGTNGFDWFGLIYSIVIIVVIVLVVYYLARLLFKANKALDKYLKDEKTKDSAQDK